jgi:hypothetical protein
LKEKSNYLNFRLNTLFYKKFNEDVANFCFFFEESLDTELKYYLSFFIDDIGQVYAKVAFLSTLNYLREKPYDVNGPKLFLKKEAAYNRLYLHLKDFVLTRRFFSNEINNIYKKYYFNVFKLKFSGYFDQNDFMFFGKKFDVRRLNIKKTIIYKKDLVKKFYYQKIFNLYGVLPFKIQQTFISIFFFKRFFLTSYKKDKFTFVSTFGFKVFLYFFLYWFRFMSLNKMYIYLFFSFI